MDVNDNSTDKCNFDDWNDICVLKLGFNMCTRGSRGLAPGKL